MEGRTKHHTLSMLGVSFALCLVFLFMSRGASANGMWEYSMDGDFSGYGDILAIEFGETQSRVGVNLNGTFHLFDIEDGLGGWDDVMPSCVAFTATAGSGFGTGPVGKTAEPALQHLSGDQILAGDIKAQPYVVGKAALMRGVQRPGSLVCGIRHIMGRDITDRSFWDEVGKLPYLAMEHEIIGISKPHYKVHVQDQANIIHELHPEEIAAHIFSKLKSTAETFLDHNVSHAIVTVPAYFTDAQRQSVKDAALIAGLQVLRVVKEPTAALIGHSLDQREDEELFVVYHLGDASCDITLASIDRGVIEILAAVSDRSLGMRTYERILEDLLVEQFEKEGVYEPLIDREAMADLREKLKGEKNLWKGVDEVGAAELLRVQWLYGEKWAAVTKAQFLARREEFFQKTVEAVDRVMVLTERPQKDYYPDGVVQKKEVLNIVPIGELEHIKQAQPLLKKYFDDVDKLLLDDIPTEEAIVRGAGKQAAVLSGVDDWDGGCQFMEVMPLSVGFSLANGLVVKVVPRNTVIPTRKSRTITTVRDDQEKIVLHMYEGERPLLSQNRQLGSLVIDDIPLAPAGVPRFEVSFELDADGRLSVMATEKGDGEGERREVKWLAENQLGFDGKTLGFGEKVDAIVQEAEMSAEEDQAVRLRLENGEGAEEDEFGAHLVNVQAVNNWRAMEDLSWWRLFMGRWFW